MRHQRCCAPRYCPIMLDDARLPLSYISTSAARFFCAAADVRTSRDADARYAWMSLRRRAHRRAKRPTPRHVSGAAAVDNSLRNGAGQNTAASMVRLLTAFMSRQNAWRSAGFCVGSAYARCHCRAIYAEDFCRVDGPPRRQWILISEDCRTGFVAARDDEEDKHAPVALKPTTSPAKFYRPSCYTLLNS